MLLGVVAFIVLLLLLLSQGTDPLVSFVAAFVAGYYIYYAMKKRKAKDESAEEQSDSKKSQPSKQPPVLMNSDFDWSKTSSSSPAATLPKRLNERGELVTPNAGSGEQTGDAIPTAGSAPRSGSLPALNATVTQPGASSASGMWRPPITTSEYDYDSLTRVDLSTAGEHIHKNLQTSVPCSQRMMSRVWRY